MNGLPNIKMDNHYNLQHDNVETIVVNIGCTIQNLTCIKILRQMAQRSTSQDLVKIKDDLDIIIKHSENHYNDNIIDHPDAYYYVTLWTIVVPIVFAFIILIGILGNTLVIYVVLTTPKLRTSTHNYLVNLAVSDITVLTICVPFQAYKYASWSWEMGDMWCRIMQYLLFVTIYVTIWTLVSIAVMRYIVLVHTASKLNKCLAERSIWICVALWVIILLVNIPTLLAHKVNTIEDYTYCGVAKESTRHMFISFFICAYILPLCLICIFYLLVIHHLHMNMTNTYVSKKNYTFRVSKVVIVVVLVFSACWLPYHIHSFVSLYGTIPKGKWYEVFRVLWHCLIYGNSLANPFIYNFVSVDFREAFKATLSCERFKNRKPLDSFRLSSQRTERVYV